MSSSDVESQQGGSRCRRMDACLLGSVLALFALVLAGFTVALLFARSLRADVDKLQSPDGPDSPEFGYARAQADPRYKVQNFAYLRASNSEVEDGVMSWESIAYGTGQTVGSKYSYNSNQKTLTVDHEGSYFLYTQLNLTCLHVCTSGSFTISFEDNHRTRHLSCPIHLPANHFEPVVKKCWAVLPRLAKNSRLLARVHLHTDLTNWSLEPNSSGFGMFLVDGPETE